MFGGDNNFVGNQVGRVESHTELANHRNISTSLEGLHEGLCSGLGDGSQVVDKISLKKSKQISQNRIWSTNDVTKRALYLVHLIEKQYESRIFTTKFLFIYFKHFLQGKVFLAF